MNDIRVINGQFYDVTDEEKFGEDVDSQLEKIFSELGSDIDEENIVIHVNKILDMKGEKAYCFRCLPSELPILDTIRSKFGPGKYEVWVYRNKKRFRKRDLVIAETIQEKEGIKENPTSQMNNVEAILNYAEKLNDSRRIVRANNVGDGVDGLSNLESTIRIISELKSVFSPNHENQFSMFKEGISFAKDLMGESQEKNNTDVIYKAIETLPGIIENISKNKTVQKMPVQEKTMIADEKNADEEGKDMNSSLERKAEAMVNQYLLYAREDKDPILYADLFIDQLPDSQMYAALQFFKGEDSFDKIVAINKEALIYEEWFKQFSQHIVVVLNDLLSVREKSSRKENNEDKQDEN